MDFRPQITELGLKMFEAPPHSSHFLNLKSQLATYLSPRLPYQQGHCPRHSLWSARVLSPHLDNRVVVHCLLLHHFVFKRDSLFVDVLWVFEVSIGRFPGDTAPQIWCTTNLGPFWQAPVSVIAVMGHRRLCHATSKITFPGSWALRWTFCEKKSESSGYAYDANVFCVPTFLIKSVASKCLSRPCDCLPAFSDSAISGWYRW